jgi:UDP:flavonoid glycosyltransferase YjiC (YdhE family)
VFSPGNFKDPVTGLDPITADKVVLVVDKAPNRDQMGTWFSFDLGPMSWAPTNRWVRAKLEECGFPVRLEPEDWRAIGVPLHPRPRVAPKRLRPVAGRVSAAGAAQWPKTANDLKRVYPSSAPLDIWTLGAPPTELRNASPGRKKWVILSADDISVERFMEAIDAFVYFPGALTPELPDAAIATAMASGIPVVLAPHLEPHFGPGAMYAEPSEALAMTAALLEDEAALEDRRRLARDYAGYLFSGEAQLARVEALAGPPPKRQSGRAGRKTAARGKKRVLFVPSNGIGLGHTTRLLAIARRLDVRAEPVFASLGQASSIIEAFGYTAEYIPSYTDIGASVDDWDPWFRHELSDVIARHRPDVVIYDGNNPTPGLVHAALSGGACRLAWVRRGMCPQKPSPYLENARFFDCVIEPGDFAGDRDTGPTVALRHEVQSVPPIRLLDGDELLDRETARRELGLSPDKPAVLIHLGAGGTRDVIDLTDRVVADLRRFDGPQIMIAEWGNGSFRMPRWPGTSVLRGFPISRFFHAFDFSVAAAGYNSFHEVISFGLPTVFLANRHPSMDDQGGRAAFAQDSGVGFDLAEEEFALFPALCEAMLNPNANAVLRRNCAAFGAVNGAEASAELVMDLFGAS